MTHPQSPVKLNSFADFDEAVANLKNDLKQLKQQDLVQSEILFRGQANAEWGLETTLERFNSSRIVTTNKYNSYLARAKPAVETITGKIWPFESRNETPDLGLIDWSPQNYEFMVYARHHGYPSPLLDWTRSPYIALYFAFANSLPSKDVAIFAYCSMPQGMKGGGWTTDDTLVNPPVIRELGPFATTHPRQFPQQSRYTICTQIRKGSDREYCSHELVFQNAREGQDLMYKYILSASLRFDLLDRLDHMNINGFTLFNSEDGLMSALAFREIEAFEAKNSDRNSMSSELCMKSQQTD
jgi:hypothetical protein